MRALLVAQEYPPETGWGGIGTYTWMLGQGLRMLGHEVHVLSVTPGMVSSDHSQDGVVVHRRPLRKIRGIGRLLGLTTSYEYLALSWCVYREFSRLQAVHRFDVVELPNWKAEGFFIVRRKPVPSTMRLHSMAFQLFPHMAVKGLDARLAISMEESTVKRVGVAHAPERHLQMVRERLGLDQQWTRVIPAPVMVPPDPGPPPLDPPRILFAGRFEPRKNPETIIRAAPKVLAEFPNARFVFVGKDWAAGGHDSYLAWMKSLADGLGVSASIEIVDGWQSNAVAQQMPLALVVVVPSRSESFGYVAAEASSYGRCVVASRVDGLAQLVHEGVTGALASPEVPDEWSEAIIGLLRDPEQTIEKGRRGRQFVESTLSAGVIAGYMTEAFQLATKRFGDGV